jgi:hypothetical protein
MEQTVMGLIDLVSQTFNWGIGNALPIAVGALLGSHLFRAGLGLVSDVLGRGRTLVDNTTAMIAGK